MKKLLFVFFCFLFSGSISQVWAQSEGYDIKVKIDGFEEDTLFLGYYYMDKQYLLDTVAIGADGTFNFKDKKKLDGGIYLVVLPPDNNFFQLLIDPSDTQFSVETKLPDMMAAMKIKGSKDNELFYEYMQYLSSKRPASEKLRAEIEATTDAEEKEKLTKKLDALDQEVTDYQDNLIKKYPKYLFSSIIQATRPMKYPEFRDVKAEDLELAKWRYSQKHFFDDFDLSDPRLLRTPFMFQRVDTYISKLAVQIPDSVNVALDFILSKMKPAEDTYKSYLIHYLNSFANPKIVGFDACYVHIAENYYAKGLAPWTDEETMKKIIDQAAKTKPLLIGKIAPDIMMQTKDGTSRNLHGVDADYTVLYFWRPDCGHCKKVAPQVVEFHKKYKPKGVEIFGVCVKFMDEVEGCWEMIEEKEFSDFINVVDPYHRSKFHDIYDVKTTPKIFILNRKHEIISKGISAEQLDEVMGKIIEMDTEKTK